MFSMQCRKNFTVEDNKRKNEIANFEHRTLQSLRKNKNNNCHTHQEHLQITSTSDASVKETLLLMMVI